MGPLPKHNLIRLSKPILVATSAYPPLITGSSIIMSNLLRVFAPESIILATHKYHERDNTSTDSFRKHYVMNSIAFGSSPDLLWQYIQVSFAAKKIAQLVDSYNCKAIVGVFPSIFFLDASMRAANKLKLPFVAYLHDTIVESLYNSPFEKYAQRVQEEVFSSAKNVFVINENMKEFYEKKYKVSSVSIPHSYPEDIPDLPQDSPAQPTCFWGGEIYRINQASLLRVYNATRQIPNLKLLMASRLSRKDLQSFGFQDGFDLRLFQNREQYLKELRQQAFGIVTLDWPDETSLHEDELSTVFPTKTVEYLASGRPILVHCPRHYYLGRFFIENNCGEVVTERSIDKLVDAIHRIISNKERSNILCMNALKVAREFRILTLANKFKIEIENILE